MTVFLAGCQGEKRLTARIDPYDPLKPKIPYDEELFHAHMAQAFRHSRVSLFIAVPAVLKPLVGEGAEVGSVKEVFDNINWYASIKDRTVATAVSTATQEKEFGNMWVFGVCEDMENHRGATLMRIGKLGRKGTR